jgi:lactoylglutathione lyase
MIDTIGGTVVMVSDQKKAVDFYTKALGFKVKVDLPFGTMRWIEVAPKGGESSISLMEPNLQMMSKDQFESAMKSLGEETGIWFYTKDIKSTYEELMKQNVNITQPEKQEWGGTMSKIRDHDGNSFSLISSPT